MRRAILALCSIGCGSSHDAAPVKPVDVVATPAPAAVPAPVAPVDAAVMPDEPKDVVIVPKKTTIKDLVQPVKIEKQELRDETHEQAGVTGDVDDLAGGAVPPPPPLHVSLLAGGDVELRGFVARRMVQLETCFDHAPKPPRGSLVLALVVDADGNLTAHASGDGGAGFLSCAELAIRGAAPTASGHKSTIRLRLGS